MVVLRLWTESQTFQVRVLGKADRVPALAAVDSARLALPGIIQISWAQDGQAHMFFPHPSSQPHVCKNALFRRNSFLKYLPVWPPKIDFPAYYVLLMTQTPSVLWALRIAGPEATAAPVVYNIPKVVWCPSMQRILKKQMNLWKILPHQLRGGTRETEVGRNWAQSTLLSSRSYASKEKVIILETEK